MNEELCQFLCGWPVNDMCYGCTVVCYASQLRCVLRARSPFFSLSPLFFLSLLSLVSLSFDMYCVHPLPIFKKPSLWVVFTVVTRH
jgi:hypothetical protein